MRFDAEETSTRNKSPYVPRKGKVSFLKLSNGKTETEVQIPKKETKGTLVQLANSSACERTVLLRYW